MSIVLYVLGGWVLLNILFAAGMYFRPRRRPAAGSAPDPAPGRARETGDGARGRQPAMLERLLLFGLWLGDNRRSG